MLVTYINAPSSLVVFMSLYSLYMLTTLVFAYMICCFLEFCVSVACLFPMFWCALVASYKSLLTYLLTYFFPFMSFCLHVSYLRFNGRFPSQPGARRFALGFLPSSFACSGSTIRDKWRRFLRAECPSCHPANSVKALKALKALTPTIGQASSFRSSSSTTLLSLDALLPLRQRSYTNTCIYLCLSVSTCISVNMWYVCVIQVTRSVSRWLTRSRWPCAVMVSASSKPISPRLSSSRLLQLTYRTLMSSSQVCSSLCVSVSLPVSLVSVSAFAFVYNRDWPKFSFVFVFVAQWF